jgi:hypothetical protein
MSSSDAHAIAVARAEVARRGHFIPLTWDAGVMPLHTAPEPGPTKQIVWFCKDRTFGSRVFGVVVDPVTGKVEEFIDMRHHPTPPQIPPNLLRRLKRPNHAMERTAGSRTI